MPFDSAYLYRQIDQLTTEIRKLRKDLADHERRELSTRRVADVTNDQTPTSPRSKRARAAKTR